MIEAQKLTKRYGPVTAIDDVSFEVRKGEVLGFLGPNGAGKTTTMKILTCFIAPTDGSAKVNGCDVFDDAMGVRKAIGYLPEANPLYVEMLVLEYLEWVARMRGLKGEAARKQMRRVVEETSIKDVIAKEIRALSKGYRQRVGLAAALMHEPPILILDEPMSGLDPNQAMEIRELIKDIGKERTVILSTHNLAEVQLTCNRVLIIANGQIVADDRPDELRARAGKPRYFVSLREGNGAGSYRDSADEPRKVFERVPGIDNVEVVAGSPAGEIHLVLTSSRAEDLRHELFEAVVEAKLDLLEIGRKHVDLESVFRELTKDQPATKRGKRKKARDAKKKRDTERRRRQREEAARAAEEDDEEEDEEEEAEENEEEEAPETSAAESSEDEEDESEEEEEEEEEESEEDDESEEEDESEEDEDDAGDEEEEEEEDDEDEDDEDEDDEKKGGE